MNEPTFYEIKVVINKLPHSKTRVPYTYYHDFLRENFKYFANLSRAEVAEKHNHTKKEMYAICLVQILKRSNVMEASDLDKNDFDICEKCIKILENLIIKPPCQQH